MDLAALTSTFSDKGSTSKKIVALLGAHTIGQARCTTFQNRIYQETNISSAFEISLQWNCLRTGSDENVSPLHTISPVTFDNAYFKDLVNNKVLLHSDQQLYNNGSTKTQAAAYSTKSATFHADFAATMLKMGNLCPLTGLMARFEQIAEK